MKYLRILKRLALCSDHHSHKMSCILVRGGKIIGRGYNMLKSHPNSPHPRFRQRHAEFNAIISASYDVRGATAYIFREQKDGTLAIAKPCTSCSAFLVANGVTEIIYSFQGSYKEEKLG